MSTITRSGSLTGIDLFSAGDFAPGADKEEIVLQDANRGVYKRIILRDKKIVGAVLYGDTVDGPWYFQHLRDGIAQLPPHRDLDLESRAPALRQVVALRAPVVFGRAPLSLDQAQRSRRWCAERGTLGGS